MLIRVGNVGRIGRTRSRSNGVAPTYLPTVSVAPVLAQGTQKLISSYSGALVRVVRPSDTTTISVMPTATGSFDTAAYDAFMGSQLGQVDVLYDQSASAAHSVQATANSRPKLASNTRVRGKQPISFNGGGGPSADVGNNFMSIPSAWTLANTGVTVFVVCGIKAFGYANTIVSLGVADATNGTFGVLLGSTSHTPSASVGQCFTRANTGTGTVNKTPTLTPQTTQQQVVQINIASGGSPSLMFNETAVSTTGGGVVGATTYVGGQIGALSSGSYGATDTWTIIVYPAVLSAPDAAAVRAALYDMFDIRTALDSQLIETGNSIVAGSRATANMNNVKQALPLFSKPIIIRNHGIPSELASEVYTGRAFYTGLYNGALAKNLIIAPEATNDINAAASGSIVGVGTTYWNSYVKPCIQDWTTAGFKVFVPTIIGRTWTGSGTDQSQKANEAAAYNALAASEVAGLGAVLLDYAALTHAQTASNTTYFDDGVHPTTVLYAEMAAVKATAINANL